ncbi:VanW family protein [Sporomusa termitida]|uniref:VanW like protein n=1 Tax=Sporomusa termitida TaxID=2377 RepID=A0A517DN51_9FIRM|nr:VanW family protein [Sporomusa termitida]QDR78785.1 VanW like protein [Sporomusa termitida]
MKHWMGIILAVAIILTGIAAFWLTRPLFAQTVYSGVRVANIEVAGKSRDEVAQMLSVWQKDQVGRPILLTYGSATFRIEPEHIDYSIDAEATADAAWQVGREGSWWQRLKKISDVQVEGWSTPLKIRYNENKLDTVLEQLQENINKPPRNATLSLHTGGIVSEVEGQEIDVAALKKLMLSAVNRSETNTIILPVKPVYPEITAEELAKNGIKELVAVYTTVFNTEDANRTANVKLSAQKINGKLLYPGQVFSYNDTVGPREKSQGFKEAMEIINGEFVPGIGGGVCQVSSTLYNAVLLAGLNIVERTNHSKPLAYVPLGRDATVAYNTLDFKFANNSSAPVMIMAEAEGNKLNVGIFGQRALDKNIDIVTVDQQVIQPATIKKADPSLPPGENKVEKPGKPGYSVTVIRIIRDNNGTELKREVLSRDKYAPDNTVIKTGPAPKPVQAETKRTKDTDKPFDAGSMQ